MYHPYNVFLFFSIVISAVLGDFVAPTYPAPRDLASNNSLVFAAWKNVTSTIGKYIEGPNSDLAAPSALKNLTFSLGMFSTLDTSAADVLQYHHASAEVANSTIGATHPNGNSIYRVASVTKLMTAFVGLLNLKDKDWNRPITDFVSELADFARKTPGGKDPVNVVQWDKVTLAALSAHLAGTPRDVSPYDPNDLAYTDPEAVTNYGLPPLSLTDPLVAPPCAYVTDGTCSPDNYTKGAEARPPTFLPWTTPQYTDFGFMMLGVAIANITNKPIHDVYRDSVFTPLNMTSSSSQPPPNSTLKNLIIPGAITNAALTPDLAPEITIPSGGLFSTTNDLAKWGIALLDSTLLPPDQTRKWMKPVQHTANLQYEIGRPWEIYRYIHPASGIITDIYTKWGDSGAYGGYMVVIPDFNAGFSMLGASSLSDRSATTALLADLITDTMLPALLAQAEAEAKHNLAGTYTSTAAGLNTTLTVSLNATKGAKPGLVLTSFISNGTDVLATETLGSSPIRLLPSISDQATGQIAFRTSAYYEPTPELFSGQLSTAIDWLTGDSGTYGGLALGLFVFDLVEGGRACAVRPAAWRVKLERKA
ncbi:MAG: hypothetical protein Q9220_003753 [cf. Caloplaca sp. 1 TL-2023]